jgi:cholest-4-en-3-one 26-monooxygenase
VGRHSGGPKLPKEIEMTTPQAEFDIDLMSGEFYGGDPYPAFAWMRENAPAFHDEANDVWALTTYEDVKAAGTDVEVFSNAGGVRPKFPPIPMMIDFDAPEHRRRRRLVSAGFTPRRVREMENHVRAVCDAVIDQICDKGACDFVQDIAAPLPLNMIGDMLGAPPGIRADLLRWSEDMLRSQGSPDPGALEGSMVAFTEYVAYIEPVLEDRRRTGADEDLVGVLVNAEIDGDRLDQQSLIHETLLILIGGDETTRHVLSGGMLALQENPDQRQALQQNPSLLPTAVEEMLRWVTPIKNMARTVTRDVEIGARLIPEGAEVLLMYPSANRDESVFEDAETFDATRTPNPHLAFGFGPHFCLGNQLARLELRVMFERIFERLPDLALSAPGPFERRPSNFISGLESLPVTYTPSPRLQEI